MDIRKAIDKLAAAIAAEHGIKSNYYAQKERIITNSQNDKAISQFVNQLNKKVYLSPNEIANWTGLRYNYVVRILNGDA